MALLLAEAQTLSQDAMQKGIVLEVVKRSALLSRLPFMPVVGNSLLIVSEDPNHRGSVAFKSPTAVWTSTEAGFSQKTFALTTLGGQAEVPNLYQKSMSDKHNQMKEQITIKSKLMAEQFEDEAVYGDVDNGGFDGLHILCSDSSRVVHAGTDTGTAPSLLKLDEMIDGVLGGPPDVLMMSKTVQRHLTSYLRTVGSYQTPRKEYGHYWEVYRDIPICASDYIVNTETAAVGAYAAKTGGANSSIFAVRFGEGDGLVGLQNGGIEHEFFKTMETKDAQMTRLKWYCGLAIFSTKSIMCLDGLIAAGTWTA